MSLKPQPIGPIPAETQRVARAAYPKGNLAMQIRDHLGPIYRDEAFAALFAHEGQPAEAPWRLALVTVVQFLENLSDRQAADAVRGRLDWKYLLGLELSDPGFDASVLCEFRQRLLEQEQEQMLFDRLLEELKQRGYLKARGRQRTDSTHVLARVRNLSRLELVGETFRAALETLALAAPQWLAPRLHPEWEERYGLPVCEYRLPSSRGEREQWALRIGADGLELLSELDKEQPPAWMRELPALRVLRTVWLQRFGQQDGQLFWRTADDLPPARRRLDSPHDPQAHFAQKRETAWVGYKVHVSETCDADLPHLITHVETTSAPCVDGASLGAIHEALDQRELLPTIHLADTGYVDTQTLQDSAQRFGVELYGPTHQAYPWQRRVDGAFTSEQFAIDWHAQTACCPQGHPSEGWSLQRTQHGCEVVKIQFARKDCQSCPCKVQCTRGERRTLTLPLLSNAQVLSAARQRQQTPEFRATYAQRAGIEGTLSQGVRGFGLRQARYRGLAKVHLQHLLTATAINLARLSAWLNGQPRSRTRQAAFVRLLPARE